VSKPSNRFVAATSSLPSADPCALPVFCALGAGHAMSVRSAMNDGRSVTASAESKASASVWTFSWY
jgi:hypothetical protein